MTEATDSPLDSFVDALLKRAADDACEQARGEKAHLTAAMHDEGKTNSSLYPMGVAKIYADIFSRSGREVIQTAVREIQERHVHLDDARSSRLKRAVESHFRTTSQRMIGELGGPRTADLQVAVQDELRNREAALNRDLSVEWLSLSSTASGDIFLSHSALDQMVAESLAEQVERAVAPRKVFVASRPGDIRPGEKWLDEIEGRLREQGRLVVLVTPSSVVRPWLWFEVGASWFGQHNTIAVCLGLKKADVPAPLNSRQVMALNDPNELAVLFRELGGSDIDTSDLARRFADLEHSLAKPSDANKNELVALVYQVRFMISEFPEDRARGETIRRITFWTESDLARIRALAATFGMTSAALAAEAYRHLLALAALGREVQQTPRQVGVHWDKFDWPRLKIAKDGAERNLVGLLDLIEPDWRRVM